MLPEVREWHRLTAGGGDSRGTVILADGMEVMGRGGMPADEIVYPADQAEELWKQY